MPVELWKHQDYTVEKGTRTRNLYDMSDPGTGKTVTHIEIYNRRSRAGRGLILCPKTLMRSAWGADLDKYFPHLTYSIADAKNRFNAFAVDTDLVIMNLDGVKDLAKLSKKDQALLLSDFDHLIVDEITGYKHPSSQRSKAAAGLAKHFDWRFGLSGTPMPISVTELWHPMMIIDRGDRLGKSSTRWRNAMQTAKQVGPMSNHLKWEDKEGAEEIAMHLLRDITVRHNFEEVMTSVPENHVDTKPYYINNKLRQMYLQLEQHSILQLQKSGVTSVHAAAVRTKLLQLLSGAVYTDSENYEVVDPGRYELIAELVQERQHSLVFFLWKHQRDLLAQYLTARGVSFAVLDGNTPDHRRVEIVRDYQDGKLQTLLLHPDTGAHGLTLTRGTTAIIASPIYRADWLKQIKHRVYRGGQTQVTNLLLVAALGTVEEPIYEALQGRATRMADFLQMMRENT
jgi:SNF2 family DNA or RNA helicase